MNGADLDQTKIASWEIKDYHYYSKVGFLRNRISQSYNTQSNCLMNLKIYKKFAATSFQIA